MATPKKPEREPARSLAEKMKIVDAYLNRGDTPVSQLAKQLGTNEALIYAYARAHANGTLEEPKKGGAKAKPKEKQTRRQYSDELKHKALAAFHSRNGRSADDIAEEHGIGITTLYKWIGDERRGIIRPPTDISTALVRAKAAVPARQEQQVALDFDDTSTLPLKLALANRNNAMLKKMVYMMLEQL